MYIGNLEVGKKPISPNLLRDEDLRGLPMLQLMN
jgi:hypothetical protein